MLRSSIQLRKPVILISVSAAIIKSLAFNQGYVEEYKEINIPMETWYQKTGDIITLKIYVQPGAKHTEIVGMHGDSLKIKLATPPIEGRANIALIRYIATIFAVPLSHITLKRGAKSRHKIIEVRASQIDPQILLRDCKKKP